MSDAAFEMVMARLREDLQLESETALAGALGMKSAAYFNRKKSGSIPYEQVIRLATVRQLDLEWILGGIAGLPLEPSDEVAEAAYPTDARSVPRLARRLFEPNPDRFSEFELLERKGILGSAGVGAENVVLEPKGALAFRRDWLLAKGVTSPSSLIVAEIVGDSMERTLFHSDTVVFSEQREVTADDIYLFCLDHRLFVKRLSYRAGGSIEVISDNRERYAPFELSIKEAQAQNFEVRGSFFWRGGDRLQ